MKKIISVFGAIALMSAVAFAQPQKGDNKCKDGEWREKVRAEQVGFITTELNLDETEAQKFWPVYNEVQSERRKAFKEMGDSYKTLKECKSDKDATMKLQKYLDAKRKCDNLDYESVERYKGVLPAEKVAKLIVAEEKFRHKQIGKLKGGNHQHGHRNGQNADQAVEAE